MSSLLPVYLTSPHSLTRSTEEEDALMVPPDNPCVDACRSQCDMCHTPDDCVPAAHRYWDLILCGACYRAVHDDPAEP